MARIAECSNCIFRIVERGYDGDIYYICDVTNYGVKFTDKCNCPKQRSLRIKEIKEFKKISHEKEN